MGGGGCGDQGAEVEVAREKRLLVVGASTVESVVPLGRRVNSGPHQGPGIAKNGGRWEVVIVQAVAGGESNPTT